MIRHIVMFTVDGQTQDEKNQQILEAATRLEGLVGVVPGLRVMNVYANAIDVPGNFDFTLVADFEDEELLRGYVTHPAHVEVAEYIGTIRTSRAAIDFDI
ncbi:Dabb family protein [Microbacterium sp. Marseille-Q6965]|uniref:Dabb family protein n=1 Tax=Microbacterium sp. Marseille-Q6965 TaxID=2965072 RepID=UPI0021B7F619|nr:Dabb family protein [Microbacterium sp. Marseille-Q6965]